MRGAIPLDRWYRYGETHGTNTIISKIDPVPNGKGSAKITRYLLLCQCGNAKISVSTPNYVRACPQCGSTRKWYHLTDKDIYGIFFED